MRPQKKLVLKPFPLNPRLCVNNLSKQQLDVVSTLKEGKNILLEGPAFSGKSVVLLHCLRAFLERAKADEEKRLYQKVWGIAPNRYRVENLNNSEVVAQNGMGRLFRTPAGMAFGILEDYFKKAHPQLPAPRLFTGDQEAAKIATIIKQQKPEWENLHYKDPVQANILEQLRELYDTCAQWGISCYDLDILGKCFGKPNWREAANKIFTYYQPQSTDQHWNQSSLQARAIEILRQWHDLDLKDHALTLPELLLVEDLQDMPASSAHLILALAGAGVQVVVVSNPKLAVENYRGGNADNQRILLEGKTHPELLNELFSAHENRGDDAKYIVPQVDFTHFKLPPRRTNLCLDGHTDKIEAPPVDMEFLTANNSDNLYRNIAIQLRKRRVVENIPWDDMAVILRNQEQIEEYQAGLEKYDIPILKTQRPIVFKNHFATGPLLNIFYYAQLLEKNETVDKYSNIDRNILLNSIFNSDYLPLDNYQICKLKQGFEALKIGMLRQQTNLKYYNLEQFLNAIGTAEYQPVVSLPNLENVLTEIERLHQWIWQAREYLEYRPLDGIDKLWKVINLAEKWRQAAINGAKYYDEALDGINSLYAHAKSWQEGYPEAQLRDYLQVIAQQAGPVDTLAKFGQSEPGIQVLSFAAAAGRIFNTVVVGGLQEGAWPNPAIRNQLFESGEIRELSTGRAVIASVGKTNMGQILRESTGASHLIKDWRAERKAIIQDEKMLFESSCARAENKLYLATVAGEEEHPSIFYHRLRKKYPEAKVFSLDTPSVSEEQKSSVVKTEICSQKGPTVIDSTANTDFNPATLRELVGELRRLIIKDQVKAREYAQVIRILADLGVENASPEAWRQYGEVGQRDFYSAIEKAIITDEQKVSISPSRLSALLKCPLRSFLEQYQGSGDDSQAAMVGTALHAVAEKMIDDSPPARRKAFFSLLPEPEDNWVDRDQYQKYEEMISRLNCYLENTKNRKILAVEKSYRVAASGNTVLNLRIDRMEEIEGRTHIVDFKTGKSITATQAQENPQLGCYQLAVKTEDAEADISGAALVYLSEHAARMGNEVPKELSQLALSEAESVNLLQAVEDSAQIMRRPYLMAVRNDSCQYCKLKKTCPISGEGTQLW